MGAAAYGAFVIHPPMIVGPALALHHVAIPAELKFVLVLAGGVAGSFGITALVMRSPAVARVVGSGSDRPRPSLADTACRAAGHPMGLHPPRSAPEALPHVMRRGSQAAAPATHEPGSG